MKPEKWFHFTLTNFFTTLFLFVYVFEEHAKIFERGTHAQKLPG